MKLTRVDAIRYGALENVTLPVSEGLTVVLGENESGKSTLTSLVRHVLYGYPDKRSVERRYEPRAGARDGALVFASSQGEWSLERVDGTHGGRVSVSTLAGEARPNLLAEVRDDIAEQTFRVVLCFGLDELALLETSKDDDLIARLYSANYGVDANPLDVRRGLLDATRDLYSAGAQKPRINALAREAKELRESIRSHEAIASRYREDRARLQAMEDRLEPLLQTKSVLEAQMRGLDRDRERLEIAVARHAELTRGISDAQREIADLERDVAALVVEPDAANALPAVTAILDDWSGVRTRLEQAASDDDGADRLERGLVSLGTLPQGVEVSPDDSAEVERWRDRLSRAEIELANARKDAERTERVARELEHEVASGAGLAEGGPGRAVLAAAVVACGLAGMVLGALAQQWLAVAASVGAALAGLALLLARRTQGGSSQLPDDVRRAQAQARASRDEATDTEAVLARLTDDWLAWVASREFGALGTGTVEVRTLIDRLRDHARILEEVRSARESARSDRAKAEEWLARLAGAARPFDPSGGQLPALSAAGEYVACIRAALDRVRMAQERQREVAAARDALAHTLKARISELTEVDVSIGAIVAERAIDPQNALTEIEALIVQAETGLATARAEYEELAQGAAELRGELQIDVRADEAALARQNLEGVSAAGAVSVAEYAKLSVATLILEKANERFAAERQPEIAKTASSVFSEMTGGAYQTVRVPMDGGAITVIDSAGRARATTKLSRGAAEQLYVALRVGLIASLESRAPALPVLMDDVMVNYDPKRQAASVAGIAELARLRQVIFFTCHPEMARMLSEGVAGAQLTRLGAS